MPLMMGMRLMSVPWLLAGNGGFVCRPAVAVDAIIAVGSESDDVGVDALQRHDCSNHTVDDKLGDAVSKNDSSLISESLQLLRTTLSNWGSIITSLGSSDSEADQITQKDEQEEAEDRQAAADEQEQQGKEQQDEEPGRQQSKHCKKHKHANGSSSDQADSSSAHEADCAERNCGTGEVSNHIGYDY